MLARLATVELGGIAPDHAQLFERNFAAFNIAVEHGLVQRVPALDHDVIHLGSETRIANQVEREVRLILLAVGHSQGHNGVMVK